MSFPAATRAIGHFAFAHSDPPNALVSPLLYGAIFDTDRFQLANAVNCIMLRTYATGFSDVDGQEFPRAEGIPNRPIISGSRLVYGTTPPVRPPSKLPPPGNLTLSLRLGERIGSGRSGVVFDVSVDADHSSPEIASLAIPPLVAKISRHKHHLDLQHEAFYYDEMECIQGIVIPRFYGLFQGRLPAGASLFPPGEREEDAMQLQPDSDSESESEDTSTDDATEDDNDVVSYLDPEIKGRLREIKEDVSIVSVLVLERLGGKLPIGEELPEDTM